MTRKSYTSVQTLLHLGLAASGLTLALSAGPAHAGGTPSGTTISNTATLNLTVGGVAQSAVGSSPNGNSTSTACDGSPRTAW